MGQIRRTWGVQKDLQVGEALKSTHFLLACTLAPQALPLLIPEGWEALADLTGVSSRNKTWRDQNDGHRHIPGLGTPRRALLSPQRPQMLLIRHELHFSLL